MPHAPVARLKKKDIIWLGTHFCKHRMTYLEHYNCYLNENPERAEIGFFDIETTDLRADWGIMLCYCLKVKDEIRFNLIEKKDILNPDVLDRNVVKACIKDLEQMDRVVGHYLTFDLPFVRTRAVFHGLPFPTYGSLFKEDTYQMCKMKLKLSRNSLQNACKAVLGVSRKNHLSLKNRILCIQGNKKELEYTLDHCKRDVCDTEDLYNALSGFVRGADSSI